LQEGADAGDHHVLVVDDHDGRLLVAILVHGSELLV
jgi:hypothetical protein